METQSKIRIVVVGGGFGGLETALYARHRLAEQADVLLVSDRTSLVFKPYMLYVPFGMDQDEMQIDLSELAQSTGFQLLEGRAETLRPGRKTIQVGERALAYDFLILATGTTLVPAEIPGMQDHALTVGHMADMLRLRQKIQQFQQEVEDGQRRRIVFVVPPTCSWAGPLYELAFMLDSWLQERGLRTGVDLTFLTPEATYMAVFGQRLHEVIQQEFQRRNITAYPEHEVRQIDAEGLTCQDGERLLYNLLIAAPLQVASTSWDPLPTDVRGFLRTELETRQVTGYPDIYAVGDGADFPVKQAFLALLQADAAAEHMAARVFEMEPAFAFTPSSSWLMDQLDQAIFARTSLSERGEAEGAAEDQLDRSHADRLPAGQLQRMLLSAHLPRPFGASNPLYTGLFWKGTQVGLKMLSSLAQDFFEAGFSGKEKQSRR